MIVLPGLPLLVLQATHTGVRRPGYEARVASLESVVYPTNIIIIITDLVTRMWDYMDCLIVITHTQVLRRPQTQLMVNGENWSHNSDTAIEQSCVWLLLIIILIPNVCSPSLVISTSFSILDCLQEEIRWFE